jgi:hypothetical protein
MAHQEHDSALRMARGGPTATKPSMRSARPKMGKITVVMIGSAPGSIEAPREK